MKRLIFLLSTLLFTLVFYNQSPGINVLLFNVFCIAGLFLLKKINLNTGLSKIVFTGLLSSIFFVVYHNTYSAMTLHIINWVVFVGVINFAESKRLTSLVLIGFINGIMGVGIAIKSALQSDKKSIKKPKIKLQLYLIPLVIIFVFLLIYRASNPVFDDFMGSIFDVIFKPFNYINLDYVPTYILGVLLCAPLFYELKHPKIELKDIQSTDELKRIRIRLRKRKFKINGLTNEYQAGVFLLLALNLLLFVVNLFDVYAVWFNFKFAGQTLKTFVHQGTYMLIFSILISMGIVLFFFRKNLNFYKQNAKLKTLTYIWIAQNILLTGSVFARCYHYINHFGLAYKRIGVILFLLAVIVGLLSVFVKVKDIKSTDYLVRINGLSVFILLNTLAFFNWDVLIAKYNLSNYKKSYVHLIYLSQLSDNALYALDLNPEHLQHISELQRERYSFSSFESSSLNINSEEYHSRIENRINTFKTKWQKKHWLSWNYAEYLCYQQLTKQTP